MAWTTPLLNRRSLRSLKSRRTPAANTGIPPPSRTGYHSSSTTSTRSNRNASAASVGPPSQITVARRFDLGHHLRVELPFQSSARRMHLRQRRGEDDLIRRLPRGGEPCRLRRLLGHRRIGLPHGHRLVRPPPVEVRADLREARGQRRHDLLVRRRPRVVPVADESVQRRLRQVDQPSHVRPSAFTTAHPDRRSPSAKEDRRRPRFSSVSGKSAWAATSAGDHPRRAVARPWDAGRGHQTSTAASVPARQRITPRHPPWSVRAGDTPTTSDQA